MEQLNRVEIRGTVGNVRVQNFDDTQAANFSVVTNYVYKSRSGDAVVETCWFSVNAWKNKNMPEDLGQITKGSHVHVTGRFREREYTADDGTVRKVQEVFAYSVELLPKEVN